MITLEDCIAFCGMNEEVVLVIAEHEHVPEIVAASLASSLLSLENGAEKVRNMLPDQRKHRRIGIKHRRKRGLS